MQPENLTSDRLVQPILSETNTEVFMLDLSKRYTSNNYGAFKITNYVNAKEVYIEFIASKIRAKTTAGHIRSGKVMYNKYKDLSKIYSSKNYGDFKVIKFVSTREIYIEFVNTKTRKKTNAGNIKSGRVYDKNLSQYTKDIYKSEKKPLDLEDYADIEDNANESSIRMRSPGGELYEFWDLKQFCKEYNLSLGVMIAVSTGVVSEWNGWTKYIDKRP